MNETEIIQGARELLSDPNAWGKDHSDRGGQLCVMGAVCIAAGQGTYTHYCTNDPGINRVKDLLKQHLPGNFSEAFVYNDHPDTTHADIINLLDKCLADLGALA